MSINCVWLTDISATALVCMWLLLGHAKSQCYSIQKYKKLTINQCHWKYLSEFGTPCVLRKMELQYAYWLVQTQN